MSSRGCRTFPFPNASRAGRFPSMSTSEGVRASFDLTLYPTIYARTGVRTVVTWGELVDGFSNHHRLVRKDEAPGFGPYALLDRPCRRPDHEAGPHRCDGLVDALSLAVFDVDCGTLDDVAECDRRLAPFTRLWYSSHSYRPEAERPSLRLVVPLLRPVPADRWASFRRLFARAYRVPADLAKCGGLSHFYYAPTCPPDIEPVFEVAEGRLFDPSTLPTEARTPTLFVRPSDDSFDEPSDPARLDAHRTRLAQIHRRWTGSFRPELQERGKVLGRLLAGAVLAEHGSRNATTARTAFDLCRLLPDANPAEVLELLVPSVKAMMAAGSRLTPSTVRKMVASGAAKVNAARERDQAIEAYLVNKLSRL